MSIKSHITDPSTGVKASVVADTDVPALAVFTRPLKEFTNTPKFFTDNDGGVDMNIGVVVGTDPEEIYDGGDRSDWVWSLPVGNAGDFDAESTVRAKNGNIKFNNNTIDDITITFTIDTVAIAAIVEGIAWNKGADKGASADALAVYLNASVSTITAVSDTVDSVMVYTTLSTADLTSIAIGGGNAANAPATAQSIDAVDAKENDVMQLTSAGDFDTTGHTGITGWVYVTKWKNEGLTISGWDDGESTIVGSSVNITAYVGNATNEWQQFFIPFTDMGLTNTSSGFDALRISPQHKGFNFYIDFIEIQQEGTVDPTSFYLKPDKGTWLHVESFQISIADEINSTIANGTVPGLSYDSLLGLTSLSGGILYQRIQNGQVLQTQVLDNLSQILQTPRTFISNSMYDSSNTYITITSEIYEPLVLKSEDNDEIRILISQSTAGLLLFRWMAACKKECRSLDGSHSLPIDFCENKV